MAKETTKKCPHCSATIGIEDTKCFSCGNKVGEPNRFGIAKKPINWWGNISAILACGGFIYYLYWLFAMKGK
ncbi:MAG: hypothetical protein GY795_29125 [Desulfobacterales bacterium]|nr:hypothetical protein [Desulfobacterales bacterium]